MDPAATPRTGAKPPRPTSPDRPDASLIERTLTQRTFDLLVIGGGINGAAIARDAALRGMSVVLCERKDWSWATSAKSSKLAHGGLRYLEQMEFGLVHEALQDRERLLRQAPHLVRPLRFLYPIYPEVAARRAVRVGLWLYDLLSHGKSVPGRGYLTPTAAVAQVPVLNSERLQGAATFYDAQIQSVERLVWEMVQDAQAHGALALNHTPFMRFLRDGDTIQGGVLVIEGKEVQVKARATVNATGCWVDDTLGPLAPSRPLVRKTKGVHVVVPKFCDDALIVKSAADGRTFFILPWQDHCILGTTDTDYTGDAGDATATTADVQYLIDSARRYVPAAPVDQVAYTYAGVRALVNQAGLTESNVTRRHIVYDHGGSKRDKGGKRRIGARGVRPLAGLWSLQGGKITTSRSLAQETVDRVAHFLQHPAARDHPTLESALPGAPPEGEAWAMWRDKAVEDARRSWRLPEATAAHLVDTYGSQWAVVLACDSRPQALRQIVAHQPHLYAEVSAAVKREQARDLGDVMLRRTTLGLAPNGDPEAAHRVAAWMAQLCGWDDAELERQLEAYAAEAAHLAVPAFARATSGPSASPADAAAPSWTAQRGRSPAAAR